MKTTLTEHMEEGLQKYVPPHIHESIRLWITKGHPLGHFLKAVIENDLRSAMNRADPQNRLKLYDIIRFFTNHAPAMCWGYTGATKAWRKHLQQEEIF